MHPDEGAVGERAAEAAVARKVQTQRRHVRTQGVVRLDGARHHVGLLRHDARIDVLPPIAVGPAIEGPVAHLGQIVGDQLRPQFVAFVDHRPQQAGARFDGQGRGIADAGGDGAARAGGAVDFPDHRPFLLDLQTPFPDVGVGADADIELGPVGAGRHGLGPVVVQARRQFGDPFGRGGDARLTGLEREADQGVLFGDIEIAVDPGQAVGGVQVLDQNGAKFRHTVVVGVTQQGDAVAALDLGVALFLDHPSDHVLWPHRRRAAATPLGDQHIAIGQHQHLARNLQIGGEGGDGEALRHRRRLPVPAGRRADLHGRDQGLVDLGQVGRGALLVQTGIAGGAAGRHGQGDGQGRDAGGERVLVHRTISRAV